MNRDEVIELLLENTPTILIIINRVKQRQIVQSDNLFEDEIRSQFLDLVRGELVNELYNKGLTIEDLSVIITEDEFSGFVEEVLKHE